MYIQLLENSKIYVYGAIGFVVIGIIIGLLLLIKRKKPQVKALSNDYINQLYEALGSNRNIKQLELVQKRLQIEVNQLASVNQELLKRLDTPAFVTGKKITLLIKDNANEVFKYLNEKRKEEA